MRMMDPAAKSKETIRLLWEVEEVLPEVLQATAGLDSLHAKALRLRLEALLSRARALREATDCLPAAEAGRPPG